MFEANIIREWFCLRRSIFSEVRVVIDNGEVNKGKYIAFIYGRLGKDQEKCVARIDLKDKKDLTELNPYQWL